MLKIPTILQNALDRDVEFLMTEECEWKLDISEQPPYINIPNQAQILVFANNGYGDYLFLKVCGNEYNEDVFVFWHEEAKVDKINDELDLLLEVRERPVSGGYPRAIYASGDLVELNDCVEVKVWSQFWKGWQSGVVKYVPGISACKVKYEYNGLKWVGITFNDGEVCPLVDPKTGILNKMRLKYRVNSSNPNHSLIIS